jgi:hypothetical protein
MKSAMRFPVRLLACAASLVLCPPALAQEASPRAASTANAWLFWSTSTGPVERPSNGTDALASGGALTVIGTLSFVSAPICRTGVVPLAEQGPCFTTSFVAGTPFLVLGVPLIVFGAVQRAKYNDWARKHPTLVGLVFSPTPTGGTVAWSTQF